LLPLSQDETEQIYGTCAEHQEATPPSELKEGIKSSVRKNHLAKIMKIHPDWSIPGKYSKKENPDEIKQSKISAMIPCGADKSRDKDTEPPTRSTLFDCLIKKVAAKLLKLSNLHEFINNFCPIDPYFCLNLLKSRNSFQFDTRKYISKKLFPQYFTNCLINHLLFCAVRTSN
jgi:hypothetical protein